MSYSISGRVREHESQRGVQGLIVCAFIPGGALDEDLPITVTNSEGRFKVVFKAADMPGIFKARAKVHLRLVAPPFRFLMITRQSALLGEKSEEVFEIEIPRQVLGALSPTQLGGAVEAGLDLAPSDLNIEKQGLLDVPRLAGFFNKGQVGAPSLPEKSQYIVLPLGARIVEVQVHPGEPVRTRAGVQPLPVQFPEPSPGSQFLKPRYPGFPARVRLTPLSPEIVKRVTPYPDALVVQGSVNVYHPVQIVKMHVRPVQYDPVGHGYVFYPKLRYTVRYDLQGEKPSNKQVGRQTVRRSQLAKVQAFVDRSDSYLAREIGMGLEFVDVVRKQRVPCVVITDNHTWPATITENGQTRLPTSGDVDTGLVRKVGDDGYGNGLGPPARFELLAKWKTMRGVRTKVVTIEDILAERFGDCTEGGYARDLHEVIRNFIRKAHKDWDTEYVLLGGNSKIVPMRSLVGQITCSGRYPGWDFYKYPSEDAPKGVPPPRGRLMDGASRAYLCHDQGLGDPTSTTPLCTYRGEVIHFKTEPTGDQMGWYFADEKFNPLAGLSPVWYPNPKAYGDTPVGRNVCNIVVEGPASVIDDDFYWVFDLRLVPSDLYYACLDPTGMILATPQKERSSDLNDTRPVAQPNYPPKWHAFDLNGNGLYGQYRWDEEKQEEVTIDGHHPALPDVWVGRVPVATGLDAQHFVDKVLTYERLEAPCGEKLDTGSGEPVDSSYLKRIVLTADLMGEDVNTIWQNPGLNQKTPPEIGTFVHSPSDMTVIVGVQENLLGFLKDANVKTHAVARFHRAERPYGDDLEVSAATSEYPPGSPTWQFVKLNSQNQFVASPQPTEFVRLSGSAFKIQPSRIVWFYSARNEVPWQSDSESNRQAEDLRSSFNSLFPDFCQYSHFYADYFDVPDTHAVQPLTVRNTRTALDNSCHLLCPKGHGGYNGVSMIWWRGMEGASPTFKNQDQYFIAYANTCLTAQPDYVEGGVNYPSLGEVSVLCQDGGAVAYVGYTRFGFGEEGHSQQKHFWNNIKRYRRIGPAAGLQVENQILWINYIQMLYGDPEMSVWTGTPKEYHVVYPDYHAPHQKTLTICVFHQNQPLADQRVTLMSDWIGSGTEPKIYQSVQTSEQGTAQFDLDPLPEGVTELTITVTSDSGKIFVMPDQSNWGPPNYKPYSVTIPVCESQPGWRRCCHCQTLFYVHRAGLCPATGGDHVATEGERYRMLANSPKLASSPLTPVEQGWRWCRKCQVLFYAGVAVAYAGKCKDGLPHDGLTSGEYLLTRHWPDGHQQTTWSLCSVCNALYDQQEQGMASGTCFGGGPHQMGYYVYAVPAA